MNERGDKVEYLANNVETIITLASMVITWVLGFLAKKSPYINNNLIIIQNIVVGLIASGIYFFITKDVSTAITLSGLFAETGYNLIHNIEKLLKEEKNATNNKEISS